MHTASPKGNHIIKLNMSRTWGGKEKVRKTRPGVVASKIKSIANTVSNNMKCCQLSSPANVVHLKCCSNSVSGCSQFHLIECIHWACYSGNMFLIQGQMWWNATQNSCFFCVWSSQKWKDPGLPEVCLSLHGSTCKQRQHWATHENKMWDNTFHFQGTRVLPKPFSFDLFTADLASWDLPCKTAQNPEIPNLLQPSSSNCWSQQNPGGESEQLQGDESSTEMRSWRMYLDKQFADEAS